MMPLKCGICDLQISSNIAMAQHIQGRRHKNREIFLKNNEPIDNRSIFVQSIINLANKDINLKNIFDKYGKINHVHKINDNCAIIEFNETSTAKLALSFSDQVYKQFKLRIKKRIQKAAKINKNKPTIDKSKNNKNSPLGQRKDDTPETKQKNIIDRLKKVLTFEGQVEGLVNLISLSNKDFDDRQMLHDDMLNFLMSIDPLSKVHKFGSSISGFEVHGSDVDMFIEMPHLSLRSICKKLKSCQKFYNSHYITSKRCPVIHTCHFSTKISCDISMNNRLGMHNSLMLKKLSDHIKWLKPLVLILRYWSKLSGVSGLDKSDGSRMTNYALCMLIIFYLQQINIIPSFAYMQDIAENKLQIDNWKASFPDSLDFIKVSNNIKLEDVFFGFFKWYSDFNFEKNMISLRLGAAIDKISLFKNEYHIQMSSMVVQDPFDLSQNVCKTICPVLYNNIKEYFNLAAGLCESMIKGQGTINLALFYDFWLKNTYEIKIPPHIKSSLPKKTQDQNGMNDFTFIISLDIGKLKAEYRDRFSEISELRISWANDIAYLILHILSSIYKFDIKTVCNLPTNIGAMNYENANFECNNSEFNILSDHFNYDLNDDVVKNDHLNKDIKNTNYLNNDKDSNSDLNIIDLMKIDESGINENTSIVSTKSDETFSDISFNQGNVSINLPCLEQIISSNSENKNDALTSTHKYKYIGREDSQRNNGAEDEPINKKHKPVDSSIYNEFSSQTDGTQIFGDNAEDNSVYNCANHFNMETNYNVVTHNDKLSEINNTNILSDLDPIATNNLGESISAIHNSNKNTPLKSNRVNILMSECVTKYKLWVNRKQHLKVLRPTISNNFLLQIKITEKILSELKPGNVIESKNSFKKPGSGVKEDENIKGYLSNSQIASHDKLEFKYSIDKNEKKINDKLPNKMEKQNKHSKLNVDLKDKTLSNINKPTQLNKVKKNTKKINKGFAGIKNSNKLIADAVITSAHNSLIKNNCSQIKKDETFNNNHGNQLYIESNIISSNTISGISTNSIPRNVDSIGYNKLNDLKSKKVNKASPKNAFINKSKQIPNNINKPSNLDNNSNNTSNGKPNNKDDTEIKNKLNSVNRTQNTDTTIMDPYNNDSIDRYKLNSIINTDLKKPDAQNACIIKLQDNSNTILSTEPTSSINTVDDVINQYSAIKSKRSRRKNICYDEKNKESEKTDTSAADAVTTTVDIEGQNSENMNSENNKHYEKNTTSATDAATNSVNTDNHNNEYISCENNKANNATDCEMKLRLNIDAVDGDDFSLVVTLVPQFLKESENAKFFVSFKNVAEKIINSFLHA